MGNAKMVSNLRDSWKTSVSVDPIVIKTQDVPLAAAPVGVTGVLPREQVVADVIDDLKTSQRCDVELRFLDLLEGTIHFDSVYNYYHLFFQHFLKYFLIICYYSLSNSQIDIIIIILFVYLCN